MALNHSIDNVWCFGPLLAVLLRWTVAQFSYSGYQKGPMFGDFEAQRHWMEITVNLDATQWYTNSSDNDLLYWGLDYPPLTAYHSFINGRIAQYLNESWVELKTSRGIETYHHKLFMRSSVVLVDLLIYFTGVSFYWMSASSPIKQRDKAITAFLTLIYPGLILIDHGHFQYNCVSLGLVVWALVFFNWNHDILGSILFMLALNYKQMALYYSFPIFWYLLSRCWNSPTKSQMIFKFASIAISVIITFVVCWWPYIHDLQSTLQVLNRLFPMSRGLFEDKVANFWCSLNVVIKFKKLFSNSTLAILSALLTLIGLIPSSYQIFKSPHSNTLKYALINSSLIFFLFSFQVHEKTILFVAIPVCLLLDEHPLASLWFLLISSFSLGPLLIKDELMVPYFALNIFYLVAFFNVYGDVQLYNCLSFGGKNVTFTFFASIIGCVLLNISALIVPAPKILPDIHAVLNSLYSFAHFFAFAIYFHQLQLNVYRNTFYLTKGPPNSLTKLKKKKQN